MNYNQDMDYFFEKNIVECKCIYLKLLTTTLTPYIYEGINALYNCAVQIDAKEIELTKNNPKFERKGLLNTFQQLLLKLSNNTTDDWEKETNRIRSSSGSYNYLDNLIQCVCYANTIILSGAHTNYIPDTLKNKDNLEFDPILFVKESYIISAKKLYNNPVIFYKGDDIKTLQIKSNNREIYCLIECSIEMASVKLCPLHKLTNDFLNLNLEDIQHKKDIITNNMAAFSTFDISNNNNNNDNENLNHQNEVHDNKVNLSHDVLNDDGLNANAGESLIKTIDQEHPNNFNVDKQSSLNIETLKDTNSHINTLDNNNNVNNDLTNNQAKTEHIITTLSDGQPKNDINSIIQQSNENLGIDNSKKFKKEDLAFFVDQAKKQAVDKEASETRKTIFNSWLNS